MGRTSRGRCRTFPCMVYGKCLLAALLVEKASILLSAWIGACMEWVAERVSACNSSSTVQQHPSKPIVYWASALFVFQQLPVVSS